jgi:hypothetical protein
MRENKMVYCCAIITGFLLLFTSIIHFLNINETLVAIKTGDVSVSYASSAFGMWIFSGMSMFLLGVWVLFLSKELKKRNRKAWWQAIIIGLALSVFAIGSWLQFPKAFHFLYFLLFGLILLLPLIYYVRQFFGSERNAGINQKQIP